MTDQFLCTPISLKKGPKIDLYGESCETKAIRKVRIEIALDIDTPVMNRRGAQHNLLHLL